MVEAERDAEELRERVWKKKGPLGIYLPVDPFTIARDLGIGVFTVRELSHDISGMLKKGGGYEDPEILLSPQDSRNRQRFTCAHELGHYTRQVKRGDDGAWEFVDHRERLSAGGHDADEAYANRFAAELLMPRDIVLDQMSASNPAALAFDFGVASDAIRFRLESLDQD
jgi:IrrE N-terminal-like domain